MAEHLIQIYKTTEEAERRKEEIKNAADKLGMRWAERVKSPDKSEFVIKLDNKLLLTITVRTI